MNMGNRENRLSILEQKLLILENRHKKLSFDLDSIEKEIQDLKHSDPAKKAFIPPREVQPEPRVSYGDERIIEVAETHSEPVFEDALINQTTKKKIKSINWEKLIGENIINKVGILITIIGVGIGANYAIENDLISPTTRIILGYLFSFGLIGVAYRLRLKYLNYSSVLFGGAMASMYLLTFAAFDFYQLIPQLLTFVLLTVLTIITVGVAIGYSKEWISVFGLVGGYAIPFLVGDENGSTTVLFSYVFLLNLGVLLVSTYKYWRVLFTSAFGFTWLIFLYWFNNIDPAIRDVNLSLTFSTANFLLFYSAFLISKVRDKQELLRIDVSIILLNTFIYFGVGFETLDVTLEHLQGGFTISLAVLHFIVGKIVQRYELPSKTTLSLINGLVLVFITLSIPIQFSDKWVTMAWSLEAVLLLWLGRSKKLKVYEILSYPVILLSLLSLISYWFWFFSDLSSGTTLPFFNQLFLTTGIYLAAMILVQYLLLDKFGFSLVGEQNFLLKTAQALVPISIIVVTYLILLTEIGRVFHYWEANTYYQNPDSSGTGWYSPYNPSINLFRNLSLISYTVAFLFVGKKINDRWFKLNNVYNNIFIFSFLTMILFFASFFNAIMDLRHLYLGIIESGPFDQSVINILVRYVFIAFGLLNLVLIRQLLPHQKTGFIKAGRLELFTVFTILFLLSSELIQWLDIFGFENSYKLGLSILWGTFSVGLVLYGIIKSNQQLRIASLVLFAATLIKLFFYDITHLSTISKTVVFMSLGVLLLAISYLYNRFRERLVPNN